MSPAGTTSSVSGLSLSAEERVLWEGQPAPAVLSLWLFTKALTFAFVASFVVVWLFAFFGAMWMTATRSHRDVDPFGPIGRPLVVAAPLLLGAGFLYTVALRRTYRYFITNQRVVFTGGLLLSRRRSVHYHKITDIEVSQHIVERLLGIRTLKAYTAGTSGFTGWPWMERAEITFPGLAESDTAERLINNVLRTYRATGQ